jgi:hypothetical protein
MVQTKPLTEVLGVSTNATPYEDYLPRFDKITFLHGETEKTVSITLINEKIVKTAADLNKEEFGDGTEEVEDIQDLMFKVVIEKA